MFSFVLDPTGTSISALAYAGTTPQQVKTNPAHAADTFSYAGSQFEPAYSLSAAANATYAVTPQKLTVHSDATQSTAGGYLGWSDNSGTSAEVVLSFSLTTAATVQISGTLAGSGGATSSLHFDISDFTASSTNTSAVNQAFALQAGNHVIEVYAQGVNVQAANTASVDLTLTLGAATPPRITSANAVTFHVGQPSAFTVTTTGDPAPGIKETAFLPDALSFVDNGDGTATLSGTPAALDATGHYDLIFTASNGIAIDATHPAANQFFTLTLAGGSGKPVLAAAHMRFSGQPASVNAGATLPPVIVMLEDKTGHGATSDNSLVTISLGGAAGGVLHGTLSVQAVNGVATFSDLSITKAGTYTLDITDSSLKATSRRFTVNADSGSAHLVLSQSSADTVLVGKSLPPIVATLEDQFGNVIKNSRNYVTLVVASGPAGGDVEGKITVPVHNGLATFKNVWFSQPGTYTLELSDGALAGNAPPSLVINVTQATAAIPAPHPSRSYKTGRAVALNTTIKSNAPADIAFSGTARITDQNNNVLGTASVSANGTLHFLLAGLLPGVYVCSVNYAGAQSRAAATSAAFTLNVTK
ncbi:MAG TPA: hypothetical protein VFC78_16050 [Tepidisphaeraceae bacterium]|nr:hypothetical protein [Tepidisphaeraceae bacterium]